VLDDFRPDVARPVAAIPEGEGVVEPCWDPLLNPRGPRNRGRLVDLHRRLAARGLAGGRRRHKACVSTFFVAKKSGDIRMVVDARQPNQLHKLLSRSVLVSGEARGSINLLGAVDASPEDLADFDGCNESLCAGSVDLIDGVSQFADPSWGSWMCFDVQVTADELGIGTIYDEKLKRRVRVAPDEPIWPCFAALPMGWGWALWICREVLVDAMDVAGLPRGGWAPCVDDGNLVSLGASAISDGLDELTDELDRRGLRWRELERAQPGLVIPGIVLDGRDGGAQAPLEARVAALSLAAPRAAGALAGAPAAAADRRLMRYFSVLRPGLSVLGACCAFIGDGELAPVARLPADVLGGLATAAGFVFLAEGYAVCEARLGPREVLATARWRERRRFVAAEAEVAPDDELYAGRAAGFTDQSEPLLFVRVVCAAAFAVP
ncbi:unnamed protein product, partial [Prorocentrum cordatum]